jgi:ankyrin repeat protein
MNSPLHYALSHKNFKIANLLISKKSDEELINIKGLTPWQCIGTEID